MFPANKMDPKFNRIDILHKQETESPTPLVYTIKENNNIKAPSSSRQEDFLSFYSKILFFS